MVDAESSEEFYRNLCSLETVRSGKSGFFRDFSEHVSGVAGEAWISKVFGRLPDDEARVRALFADEKVKDAVTGTLDRTKMLYRAKDAEASRARRLEAFEAAARGEREKSVLLFSQAVLRAPATGLESFAALFPQARYPVSPFAKPAGHVATRVLVGFREMRSGGRRPDAAARVARQGGSVRRVERARARPRGLSAARGRDGEEEGGRAAGALPGGTREEAGRVRGALFAGQRSESDLSERGGVSEGERRSAPQAAGCLGSAGRARDGGRGQAGDRDQRDRSRGHAGGRAGARGLPAARVFRDPLPPLLRRVEGACRVSGLQQRRLLRQGLPRRGDSELSQVRVPDSGPAHRSGSGMSALSTLALRMVTQSGPSECANVCRALRVPISGDPTTKHRLGDLEGAAGTATATATATAAAAAAVAATAAAATGTKLGKSAKRRIRKKILRDSKYRKEKPNEEPDLRAYELVMHENRRTARDFFERSLMAAFLLKCLQTVGFFEDSSRSEAATTSSTVPTESEIAVASLLLKHLQLLQFNAHEVFETRPGKAHRFRGSKPVYIGVAIYPTVARFNHDCYPAVTRYFVGRSIVIRATRSLRVGDTVAENYGPIFTKRSLEERRRTLAGRYWFRCECTACRENWPRFEALSNEDARLRCPTEGCEKLHRQSAEPTECSACRREIDLRGLLAALRECERRYEQGFAAMEREEPAEALEALLGAAKTFHRIAVPPHRDTHLAEIAASACMSHASIRHA